jgi:glycosyltransferase involved in cell wall biosynthesis
LNQEADNRNRIVFCMPTLTGGGAERILIKYMNALDEKKYKVSYCSLLGHGPLESLIHQNIEVTSLGARRVSSSLPRLYMYLRRHKPDVIISTVTHANFACLALALFFPSTKFIAREAIVPSFFFNKYKIFKLPLILTFKILYSLFADIVISPSKEIIEEFKHDLNMSCKNFRLLYNPVDTEKISGLIESTDRNLITEQTEKSIRFVCSGRLEPQKGFDRMLHALAVANLSYQWTLTILGEGSKRQDLESLVSQYNLKDKVSFIGWHLNPYQYYATADYFLITSYYEGMPNVALESLACGTPIIAIEHPGGIFDIASKAGPERVTLAKDENEFSNLLQNLQTPITRSKKGNLLPVDFYQDTIINQFKKMVEDIL